MWSRFILAAAWLSFVSSLPISPTVGDSPSHREQDSRPLIGGRDSESAGTGETGRGVSSGWSVVDCGTCTPRVAAAALCPDMCHDEGGISLQQGDGQDTLGALVVVRGGKSPPRRGEGRPWISVGGDAVQDIRGLVKVVQAAGENIERKTGVRIGYELTVEVGDLRLFGEILPPQVKAVLFASETRIVVCPHLAQEAVEFALSESGHALLSSLFASVDETVNGFGESRVQANVTTEGAVRHWGVSELERLAVQTRRGMWNALKSRTSHPDSVLAPSEAPHKLTAVKAGNPAVSLVVNIPIKCFVCIVAMSTLVPIIVNIVLQSLTAEYCSLAQVAPEDCDRLRILMLTFGVAIMPFEVIPVAAVCTKDHHCIGVGA
mmetsp:Transcript_29500/g.68950  ORF Transcript_29500/g.68950 Transcript_29500/m.68950 type:complete len:376 (+) Transcript_29500:111-1238(+)